jgi:hypothetical protein
MTREEIKIFMLTQKPPLKQRQLAEDIEEDRSGVAQILNYLINEGSNPVYARRLRLKIAWRFELPVEEVFDDAEPATTEELAQIKEWAESRAVATV